MSTNDTPTVGFVAFGPESRALADLPDLAGTAQETAAETFRARLLARDAGTLRERQRKDFETLVHGWLGRMRREDFAMARRLNGWIFGASMAAHAMDVISYVEATQWQRIAMDALGEKA